jgi:hypothetical protein
MANNRMYLVCNVCEPKDENCLNGNGTSLCLAKWYPGGSPEGAAYYRNDDGEGLGKQFLDFLEAHKHGELASEGYTAGAGQENPVRLVYEVDGLPILEERQ